jgi:Arc/MetJ-type ribon-helix-helix transcriptional regulator
MATLIQKKVSITNEQKQFLEKYKKWGFSDQSSIIREALSLFISEFETREKKALMTQKAQELLSDYTKDKDFVAFTDLDGEDFL